MSITRDVFYCNVVFYDWFEKSFQGITVSNKRSYYVQPCESIIHVLLPFVTFEYTVM